jgi:hypothetical protein
VCVVCVQGPAYMDMVLMGFPNRSQSKTPTLAFDGSNPPQVRIVWQSRGTLERQSRFV